MTLKSLPFFLLLLTFAFGEPILDSWYLEGSRKYARIYGYESDQINQTPFTTWRNPGNETGQDEPTYAGVHEVSYDNDFVYIRSSGLGSHIMGPWWRDRNNSTADADIFLNWPGSAAYIVEIPRNPDPANPPTRATPAETGTGAIGLFVDGVAMFDSRDAFYWDPAANGGAGNTANGTGFWEQDAYFNESQTFDSGFAHQAGEIYHYHANPPALRHQLGDSVTYNAATNTYTEGPITGHSPIIGWVTDGIPIYGPYGYDDPMNASTAVRRMRSGYQLRPDLANNGDLRDTIPAWCTRYKTISPTDNLNGPTVSTTFPRGKYMQDYEYLGDTGKTLGSDFDLDEYNTRFCVTPEFPNGVRAYFVSIETDGTPKFPYNIGRLFYGRPQGGAYNNSDDRAGNDFTIPASAVIYAEGGPESPIDCFSIDSDSTAKSITLSWVGAEGGNYEIEQDYNLTTFSETRDQSIIDLTNGTPIATVTDTGIIPTESKKFYRAKLDSVASFDDTGFILDTTSEEPLTETVTFTQLLNGPADLTVLPNEALLNGEAVEVIARPTGNTVIIRHVENTLPPNAMLSLLFPGSSSYINATHVPYSTSNHNILFVIIDDWGVDSSPIDNIAGAYNGLAGTGGSALPQMPNLALLASEGYQFQHGYVSPACATTRMAIMSGRHASSTGVGSPGATANNRDAVDIMTIAEAVDASGAGYSTGLFGKWHLGSGTGANERGPSADGWDTFYGDVGGNLANYFNWERSDLGEALLNTNGQAAKERTYSTIVNTDDALNFIEANNATDTPWLCWLAYNAPHTQQEPPTLPVPPTTINGNTYTGTVGSSRENYEAALWAIDQELGRLMSKVDLDSTTIILVGDNGTPGNTIADLNLFPNNHGKGTIYNGGVHVPFIIRPAGGTTAQLITEPVGGVDIFPTMCEIMGINTTALGQDLGGESIIPLMNGTSGTDRIVVAETFASNNNGRTLRKANYKLNIHDDPEDNADVPTVEFFNLDDGLDENASNDLLRAGYTMTTAETAAYNELLSKNDTLNTPAIFYSTQPLVSNPEYVYVDLTGITGINQNTGNTVNNPPVLGSSSIQSVKIGNTTLGYEDGITGSFTRTIDENTATEDRFRVTFQFDEGLSLLPTGTYDIVVQFSGGPRVFTVTGGYNRP